LIIYLLAFSIKKSIFKNHFAKRGQFSLFASCEGKKKNHRKQSQRKSFIKTSFLYICVDNTQSQCNVCGRIPWRFFYDWLFTLKAKNVFFCIFPLFSVISPYKNKLLFFKLFIAFLNSYQNKNLLCSNFYVFALKNLK
jgi:hypothetical protein